MRSKSGEEHLEALAVAAAAPNVRSPLTGSSNVTRADVARSGIIVAHYREDLGIDVSHYFEGIDEVPIYRCEDSGYRFFHPPSIAGRSDLYEQLQEHQPYYAVWRLRREARRERIHGRNLLAVFEKRGAAATADRAARE
jgi:hypothetical protein